MLTIENQTTNTIKIDGTSVNSGETKMVAERKFQTIEILSCEGYGRCLITTDTSGRHIKSFGCLEVELDGKTNAIITSVGN